MVWILLGAAIVSEVTATISLRLSEGFSKLLPTIVVVIGYVTSFVLLARVLQHGVPIGVVYAIWSAIGVALVAIIGAVFLGDTLTAVQIGGVALVIAGVATIEMGGAH